MAVVYITKYQKLTREDHGGPNGIVQTPVEPGIEDQVAIGSSSALSREIEEGTRILRIHNDAICHIKIGPNDPVAAAGTSRRLPANTIEFIGLPPNAKGWKVAVITGT